MVSVLVLSEVDRGIDTWWGQTKDYAIGICLFSFKHAALKGWLAQNQDNMSKWSDMSTHQIVVSEIFCDHIQCITAS
jgi:hypothetical protein